MRNFVGIEIGGTKLQVVLGDEQARILDRFRFAVDPAQGAKGIRKQITEGLSKIRLHNVGGIGIGFGGPVDHTTGRILTSYQVDGWGDFVLQDWLEKKTRIPVWIDNDANIAALGEALHGAGKSVKRVFYITVGSGVGGGFVIDKKIYHGSRNSEAEIGHIRLDKTGRTVESSCSGWAVDEKVRNAISVDGESLLASLAKSYSSGHARALGPALEQGDEIARRILDDTVDDLSYGLSHAVHLLNPDIVILGGGFSLIGAPLKTGVEQKLPSYLMDVLRPGPAIQLSELGEDVVPVGALSLAINQLTSA